MKKILLLISIIYSTILFSQESISKFAPKEVEDDGILKHTENFSNNSRSSAPAVIWSEDFSSGFPAGWSSTSTNAGGGIATAPWVWSNDGSWGYWQGTQGTSAAAGISSTTASNGFLICDPDSANNTAYGQPSGTTYQYINSQFTTSSISTVGYPAVTLEFEQLFRFNNNLNLVVSVSNDSISWTDYFVQGSITNNTQSADPETVSLNISSVAANQPKVYIKIGWEARVYYWMIDDMRIIETPNNLVKISDEVTGGWWVAYQLVGGIGCDYTYNPLSQVASNPYSFEAVLTNNGSASQNMVLHAEVTDVIGNVVHTTTSNSILLSSSQQDTFMVNQPFRPTSIGQYNISMWGVGDSAFTDTTTRTTVVTDYIYGKDENIVQGTYDVATATRQNHVLTYMDIYSNVELTGVDVYIADWSVPNTPVYGVIYENDPSSNTPIYLEQTSDYQILPSDRDNWVTIKFDQPVSLMAGSAYEIGIAGYQHPTDSVGVGVSGIALGTENSLYDENGGNPNSNGPTWYYITRNPMIRMNFEPEPVSSNIVENTEIEFEIYPNPSNGVITILNASMTTDPVKICISDLLGKVVYEDNFNKIQKTKAIDISYLNSGNYILTIENLNTKLSKSLAID
tara:strand:+ start:1070 stop:2944 length:1875 start_codon:yes stop_codon:yes gene_type:complete